MPHPLHVVDVFAEARWAGNPLSVVLAAGDLDTASMQAIARETNHSETTFVTTPGPRDGAWPVRIFTPAQEIPFAGHPTLGTAWVIRRHLAAERAARVELDLGVGRVPVSFEEAEGGALAWLRAPAVELGETWPRERAARALGIEPGDVDERAPVRRVSVGISFTFVPVRGLAALQRCALDVAALRAGGGPIGIYAFCTETERPENDLQVRMLFDAGGAREDPATGSAAACLGAWLLEHPLLGEGPLSLRVEQGNAIGRPSLLHVRARRGGAGREVDVGGAVVQAVEAVLL